MVISTVQVDSFCWFWLHFKEKKAVKQNDYWQQHLKESDVASWRGIAFEVYTPPDYRGI